MSLAKEALKKMVRAAREACGNAYSPYSKIKVGAAVLTDTGEIFSGCNVENASLGLTICAERNAVFQAITNGKRKLLAVVVFTPTKTPTLPCGACRQVLGEFGDDPEVICACKGPEIIRRRMSSLLPEAYR